MCGASESGHTGHPQEEMISISKKMNFEINHWEPVSIADCWMFWIRSEDGKKLDFSEFSFIDVLEWRNYYKWISGKS